MRRFRSVGLRRGRTGRRFRRGRVGAGRRRHRSHKISGGGRAGFTRKMIIPNIYDGFGWPAKPIRGHLGYLPPYGRVSMKQGDYFQGGLIKCTMINYVNVDASNANPVLLSICASDFFGITGIAAGPPILWTALCPDVYRIMALYRGLTVCGIKLELYNEPIHDIDNANALRLVHGQTRAFSWVDQPGIPAQIVQTGWTGIANNIGALPRPTPLIGGYTGETVAMQNPSFRRARWADNLRSTHLVSKMRPFFKRYQALDYPKFKWGAANTLAPPSSSGGGTNNIAPYFANLLMSSGVSNQEDLFIFYEAYFSSGTSTVTKIMLKSTIYLRVCGRGTNVNATDAPQWAQPTATDIANPYYAAIT